jgi:hypothetical protein
MQYRNLIILSLTLGLLASCRRYQTFDEAIRNRTASTSTSSEVTSSLQNIPSLLTGENSAYWTADDNHVIIYPYLWQGEQNLGHTLQMEESLAITHSAFSQAHLDYISFDASATYPMVLLKTQSIGSTTYNLEVYQFSTDNATLLFQLTTTGDINYIVQDDPSQSSILINNYSDGAIESDYYIYNAITKQFQLERSERQSAGPALQGLRDFRTFLSGPWQSEPEEAGGLVIFMPENAQILLENQRVEIYNWINTSLFNNNINIQLRNAQVPQISATLVLNIVDANTFVLSSNSDSVLSGRYQRLNLQQDQINNQGPRPLVLHQAPFSGTYVGQNNDTLSFDYPLFSKTSQGKPPRNGSMSLFQLGDSLIMQLRYRNSYGIVEDQENYEIAFSEDSDAMRYVRLLQLKPTRLFVFGSYPLPQSSMENFEQIERIS